MVTIKDLIKNAARKRSAADKNAEKISDIKLKTSRKNQFLTFFKPETFLEKTPEQTERMIDLVFEKFEKFGVSVDGTAVYPGLSIEKLSIMDRHYGAINHLSKNASKVITPEDKNKIFELIESTGTSLPIYGGHEILDLFSDLNPNSLDDIWWENTSKRVRGGFYVRKLTIKGQDLVAVNAFHPKQLAHFTLPERLTIVMLNSSDESWKSLREEMIGDGYPEKAISSSIRGTLFNDPQGHGFDKVNISCNVIHMSAGPTEALFEMDNFFREAFGVDIVNDKALLASKLLEKGLSGKEIRELIHDKDLHGQLEHKDTFEAVSHIISKGSNDG